MVILNANSFTLPRVEKSQFITLLRLGLEYNRRNGTYRIKNYNNIKKLADILSKILGDENISFLQKCSICKKDFSCSNCNYGNICTTKNLPFDCICSTCLRKDITNTLG